VILKVTFRDRDSNSGAPARRAQCLELEAECGSDLELLGALAGLLASAGGTTAAAVRELVAKPDPAPLPVP
jgi:hypothetical protein